MKNFNRSTARSPFLFGAQYYRAPTPEEIYWEGDHARMAKLGFNSVKYWLQWRWSHRRKDRFVFDDVLRLMDIAEKHQLAVTLNAIFDIAPHWLYEKYPDAKQVMNSGRIVEPRTEAHRQIGGSPGPCYRHPGARMEREKFLTACVNAFKGHPALDMWDVWNEPELCFNQRTPDLNTLACYCQNCTGDFRLWLNKKYETLDRLNSVWGRCYEQWDEVETPKNASTLTDFIDWREFHLDTLTAEAAWRFEVLRNIDSSHVAFLHTVPNFITCFNAVTCSDDFALAPLGDLYAASYNEGGVNVPFLTSAAPGKTIYNTELHSNFGLTNMHQPRVELPDLLKILLPQIGMGVRGFQFWQFRAETLGFEAPGWGIVKTNGEDRPITQAIEEFWTKFKVVSEDLASCPPPAAEVGIWKSRKNEIFHYAIHGNLQYLKDAISPYTEFLYWQNVPYRIVDHFQLSEGRLENLKFLILPSPYLLTRGEADALNRWVSQGGVLWTEAHLGAYDGTGGRHSQEAPGCGLSQAWDIREKDSTSAYHLKFKNGQGFDGNLVSDVEKVLNGNKLTGGKFFPLTRPGGATLWAAERCGFLEGTDLQEEARLDSDHLVCASKKIGMGYLYYHGTNIGMGSLHDPKEFHAMLYKALVRAGIGPIQTVESTSRNDLHVDDLRSASGKRFLVLANRSSQELTITCQGINQFRGLWSGLLLTENRKQTIPGAFHDLFVETA